MQRRAKVQQAEQERGRHGFAGCIQRGSEQCDESPPGRALEAITERCSGSLQPFCMIES